MWKPISTEFYRFSTYWPSRLQIQFQHGFPTSAVNLVSNENRAGQSAEAVGRSAAAAAAFIPRLGGNPARRILYSSAR